MKKLILHIGSPKTGSTSIQRSIANSRRFLNKHDISVVDFWKKSPPQTYLRSFLLNEVRDKIVGDQPYSNPDRLARRIDSWGGIRRTDRGSASAILQKLIAQCSSEYVLFSWEAFWDVGVFELLMKLIASLEGAQLHKIVCFIRRQDTYAESRLQQTVRDGHIESIDTYWENLLNATESLDWCAKMTRFEEVLSDVGLPDVEFSVKAFEHASKNPGLLNAFYGELGIHDISGIVRPVRKNSRLSWFALVVAYHYRGTGDVKEFNRLMQLLTKTELGSCADYCLLGLERRKKLLDIYYPSNKGLFSSYNVGSEEAFNGWMEIEKDLASKRAIDFNDSDVTRSALIELAGLLDRQKRYFLHDDRPMTKIKSIVKLMGALVSH